MRTSATSMALAILLAAAATPAVADVFYLKDGGKIEGTGEDLGSEILIRVPLGSIRVAKSDILRVVKTRSILDLYAERLTAVEGNTTFELYTDDILVPESATVTWRRVMAETR